MRGGGGSSSENAGGLNDGCRKRWIGRTTPEFGSRVSAGRFLTKPESESGKWAACGLVKPAVGGGLLVELSTLVAEALLGFCEEFCL